MQAPTWGPGVSERGPGRGCVLAAAQVRGPWSPASPACCKGTRVSVGPLHGWAAAPPPRCPPGWQRRRWPLAVRVPAPVPLRTQQRDESRMHMVAPCLARPGRTRAVSSPRGTYTSHFPHGNGPGGGQGETQPWTSLHTWANLSRAARAHLPSTPLSQPPSQPPPDGPADTECSVCHAQVWRPVWNDPGVGGRGQVCL